MDNVSCLVWMDYKMPVRKRRLQRRLERARLLLALFKKKKKKVDFYLNLFLAASLHWNKLNSKVFFFFFTYFVVNESLFEK